MTDTGKFETIKPDHPIAQIANGIAAEAFTVASSHGISKMDVCMALANAVGLILADASKPASGGKPLPRDKALGRMDDLRRVMEAAYDLRDVEGAG